MRAKQVARLRSFSPSCGSICATATCICGESNRLAAPVRRIRFYYDVVCPYSYMETHAIEPAEDAGAVEVVWLPRSEEHTSELQSHHDLVCRLLLEKKK